MLTQALSQALESADFGAVASCQPLDEHDGLCALLAIYDLWTVPIERLAGRERFQNHPVVAALKADLEKPWVGALDQWASTQPPTPAEPVVALRALARRSDDAVYEWLARSASYDQLVSFVAVEGGPDGGFDDLVAVSQIGIRGRAKVVLGANYWDEMGRGDPDAVHTVLHDRLVKALDLPTIPRPALSVTALRRSALNGLLATNRWLQPEMIGALGLLELQAGPRCRRVVQALDRLGAPADAFPFYEEHARADPRHGKAWLDDAVQPLVQEHPEWGPRIVRGARWRAEVNDQFFAELHAALRERRLRVA
ncbi:MAG: iron-containing redox enzyme family protein [Solirubrobacterales bacterium]|nr:iron-containing redox enzyme family protein [Solirubrobacterales bacterium]